MLTGPSPRQGMKSYLTSLLNPNTHRPNLTYEFLGLTRVWRWTRKRMEAEHARGRIVQTARGRAPRYKRYLDEQRGRPLSSIWTNLLRSGREEVGYPTPKPLALLERIIKVSSERGVVLDPFAGCATACVAAEKLERQWVGIDLSAKAADLVKLRLRKEMGLFYDVRHRLDVPSRLDQGKVPDYRTHKHTL